MGNRGQGVKRDEAIGLTDRVTVEGIGYLTLLVLLGSTTIGEMCKICNRNRHTVEDYFGRFEVRGLAERVQSGRGFHWHATPGAFLALGLEVGGNPANFLTATTANRREIELQREAAAEDGDVGGNPANKPHGIDPDLAAAFRAAGIGSNAWAGLAEKDWMTPEYVRAHDDYRRARGESVGLLITRLRCGDAVPEAATVESVGNEWARALRERHQQACEMPGTVAYRLSHRDEG